MFLTSEVDTEIGQISPKYPRNPQSDFTICLPTLGRHPTFRTLVSMLKVELIPYLLLVEVWVQLFTIWNFGWF